MPRKISALPELVTVEPDDFLEISEDDGVGGWDSKKVKATNLKAYLIGNVTVFFPHADADNSYGDYLVKTVGTNGDTRISFVVPSDFLNLISLKTIACPVGAAEGAGKDIDLTSDYGADAESADFNSESDAGSTYTISADAGHWGGFDISGVFSSLAAGDRCGIYIDHNAVGGNVHYLGIEMVYAPTA